MRSRGAVSVFFVALIGAAAGCAGRSSEEGPATAPLSVTRERIVTSSTDGTVRLWDLDGTTGHQAGHAVLIPAPAQWGREVASVRAKGVQTYRVEHPVGGRPRLTFVGPRASLVDDKGRAIGTHFMGETGPVWEFDGVQVTGRKLRERPSTKSGSVPELQLAATVSGTAGPLGGVTFIERLDTVGGAAPALEDTMREGDLVDVPYEARYVFYAAAQ